MRTYNKVILMGRLGQDPDLRYTQSGAAVATISLATSHGVKKGDKWDYETEWHKVTLWGKLAEMVADRCSKGDPLFVEGELRYKNWTDAEGIQRYGVEVLAKIATPLGDGGGQAGGQRQAGDASAGGADDDVPF